MVELTSWRRRTVVAYLDEPPFFAPGAPPTGCDIELVSAVLGELGVDRVEFVLVGFDQLIDGVLACRWHVNVPMFATASRAALIRFSLPVWAAQDGLIVRVGDLRDFSSYVAMAADPSIRLAVVAAQVQRESAMRAGMPPERIVVFPDQAAACRGVLAGDVDASASTAPGNRAYLERLGDRRLMVVPLTLGPDEPAPLGAFSFHPQAGELADTFDDVLRRHLGSAEHLAMMRRYGFAADELAPAIAAARRS